MLAGLVLGSSSQVRENELNTPESVVIEQVRAVSWIKHKILFPAPDSQKLNDPGNCFALSMTHCYVFKCLLNSPNIFEDYRIFFYFLLISCPIFHLPFIGFQKLLSLSRMMFFKEGKRKKEEHV